MIEAEKAFTRIGDFESYHVNPSVRDIPGLLKIARKEFNKVPVLITEQESGETYEGLVDDLERYEVSGHEWKDVRRFTKLFAGTEDDIRKLNSSSVSVLMYILHAMNQGSDVVRVEAEACAKHLGYKGRKSVYDGLLGLLKIDFIYRKTGIDGEYFINVNKIFKGRRGKLKDKAEE